MGKAVVFLCLLLQITVAKGQDATIMQCDIALRACIDLSKEQDKEIDLLKSHIKDLDSRIADDESVITPVSVLYFVGGLLVGGLVVKALK